MKVKQFFTLQASDTLVMLNFPKLFTQTWPGL